MKEYELVFGEEHAVFFTVGMLRELMKNYPDHTPLNVCGTPGAFIVDTDGYGILLETLDCYESVELMAEAEALRDEIKAEMLSRNTEEIEAGQYIVRWTSVLTQRKKITNTEWCWLFFGAASQI